MKRLVLVLALALVSTLLFASPALAGDGTGPANMPDKTTQHLLDDVVGPFCDTCSLGFGNEQGKGIANWGYPMAYGIHIARSNIGTYIAIWGLPPGQMK